MLEVVRALMVPSRCESFHNVMDSDNSCQMRPLQTNNRGRMVGASEPPSRVNGWLVYRAPWRNKTRSSTRRLQLRALDEKKSSLKGDVVQLVVRSCPDVCI